MLRTLRALAFLSVVAMSACTAGPSYLVRTVDDWQNKGYAENPVVTSTISNILPAYPLLKFLAAIPDYLILNPVQFWAVDLWKGEGSGFQHDNPEMNHKPWYYGELGID